MEILTTPPANIVGVENRELNAIGTYLYRLSEELNYALQNLTLENFTESARQAMAAQGQTEGINPEELQAIVNNSTDDKITNEQMEASLAEQYEALKGIITKTADEVKVIIDQTKEDVQTNYSTKIESQELYNLSDKNIKTVDQELKNLSSSIQSTYVANSEFGIYKEIAEAKNKETSKYIDRIYNLYETLQTSINQAETTFENFKINTSQYIRTGLLYYETVSGVKIPRYGVAIGENLTTVDVDGVQVMERKNIYSTFTSDKLSFWQGTTEVAYISSGKLYINDAWINGTLNFGSKWQIEITNGFTLRYIGG